MTLAVFADSRLGIFREWLLESIPNAVMEPRDESISQPAREGIPAFASFDGQEIVRILGGPGMPVRTSKREVSHLGPFKPSTEEF